ncbi:anaerobic sulfatase maturase [Candidatus Poribacteria bacterium]|nr:anaerobic sulfatase maturase [Candidatus Poribacteria bacterium]
MPREGNPVNTIGKQFSLLIKPASADCNLACRYCFYYQRITDPYNFKERHRMNDEILESMISQYLGFAGKYTSFGWQGGEPLLMGLPFFQRVVEFQQKHGYKGQYVGNNVQTNATLITPQLARLFHDYNFLLGVSLDGPEEYHDHYRRYPSGRGCHARVMQSIQILNQYRVDFNILAVVNDLTAKVPDETYNYFLENGFYFLQYIPAVEFHPETGDVMGFSVKVEDYGDFLCRLFDLWYNDCEPMASIRTFENITAIYMGIPSEACVYRDNCGTYAVVEHNGDVYPCDFFVEEKWRFGNLLETPLPDLIASPKAQEFNNRKSQDHPECEECEWKFICRCGCPNYWDNTGSDYLCVAYKKFFAYTESRFKILAEKLKKQGVNQMQSPPENIQEMPVNQADKIWKTTGRNDPCPCGSGKKYKKCCMAKYS